MSPTESRWPIQLFRIVSLVVPPAIAWNATASAHASNGGVMRAVATVIGPLACLLALALTIRIADAVVRHRRATSRELTLLDRIDVLTASGSALSWLGAGAIVAAVEWKWASFSLVGLLGLGLLHGVVLWTLWAAHGEDPFRVGSVSRRFVPERPLEGAEVIEEVHLSGARVPAGFRLFASGRVGPRWPTSRHVLEAREAEGEVVADMEIGPALRGEHRAEPLVVWLQDVFGLCHSVRRRAGVASLTVLPRPRAVGGARDVLGRGGPHLEPRDATRLPTEGSLGLREYQPGDDARRIHWVRSLSAGQTVVRLPDEVPRDRPAVRLVLDTYLPGAASLACPAPGELLDAMVAVWLGVARELVAAGTRVTLVTAGPEGLATAPMRRAGGLAEQLGARAAWQDTISLDRMLTKERSVIVSCHLQPDPEGAGETRWILAREWAWTSFDHHRPPAASALLLPHPMGSPDNRWSRRRREDQRLARARRDHATFARLCGDTRRTRAVTFVAMPAESGAIRLEVLS